MVACAVKNEEVGVKPLSSPMLAPVTPVTIMGDYGINTTMEKIEDNLNQQFFNECGFIK